jgi:cupin superfamily acireductone dioxygenase involved in methionine salvage
MIIKLDTINLTDEQLDVAQSIANAEICDVSANMEIFADSLKRTYLFKNFDLMQCLYDYMKKNSIPLNGQELDRRRLEQLFFHYHTISEED